MEPCQKCQPAVTQIGWSPLEDGLECGVEKRCWQGACCDYGAFCVDKECGDDTCGGICGVCGANEYCSAGICQLLCGNGVCVDSGEDCLTCPTDCGCDPNLEECSEASTGEMVCTAKLVEIPAGSFWMGCNNCAGSEVNDTEGASDEHSYHEVYLDAYEMDRTEVTAAQYLACVSAGGCTSADTGSYATYQVAGKEDHPINWVNWTQAESFCQWAGKALCTEAQWEKGARGGCEHNGGASNCKAQSRKYPWGNEDPTCSLATMFGCPGPTKPVCSVSPAGDSPYGLCDMAGNVWEWVADWCRKYTWGNETPTCDLAVKGGCDGDTQPVCSLSPAGDSPYGLCDMAGNVGEWTADWYQSDYYCDGDGASGDEVCTECGSWPGSPNAWSNPFFTISGSCRVVRGGSFAYNVDFLRVSDRYSGHPLYTLYYLGVRCCRL